MPTSNDQKKVDKILADSPHRGGLVRMQATMVDGVAGGPLVVAFYDLGPRGYRLAGLERPEP
jgi:hypothetical protein